MKRASSPRRLLARLRRSEDGAVTIPTLLWLPMFIMIMAASVELCVLVFKQTLLERGVDLTTRIMRLGIGEMPSHETLKRSICTNIGIVPGCMDNLAVEVFPVDTTTWTAANANSVLCTDALSSDPISPHLERGASNQLMILRACLNVNLMMVANPLGAALAKNANGQTALISVTAFVNEPR